MLLLRLIIRLFLVSCSIFAAAPIAARPNIIVFFSDDHARQAISAYQQLPDAAPQVKLFKDWAPLQTPNIDRLAEQGILFANSYVSNSICGPSRASLLTGLHSHANGMLGNKGFSGNSGPNGNFDGSQQTLPKLLQSAGYHTALIGKWHLGTEPTGFDHYERLVNQGAYYHPMLRTTGASGLTNITYTGEYIADVITDRTKAWLQERMDTGRSEPFMLMVNHKGPHRNWEAGPDEIAPAYFRQAEWDFSVAPNPDTDPNDPELWTPKAVPVPTSFIDYRSDYPTRGDGSRMQLIQLSESIRMETDLKLEGNFGGIAYDELRTWWQSHSPAMTDEEKEDYYLRRYLIEYALTAQSVDRSVGDILDFLEANQLDHDTIILYSSDQGFFLGEHGWFDKRWIYEESLWTPLLMQWRDGNGISLLPAGRVIDEPVQVIDFAPTLLEAAGVTDFSDMHGESFLGLATAAVGDEPSDWRESIYYHYLHDGNAGVVAHYGMRDERFKLVNYYNLGQWEMFDLQEDPHELNNLFYDGASGTSSRPDAYLPGSSEFRTRVSELMVELRALREQYGDDLGREYTIPGIDWADRDLLLNLRARDAEYEGGRTPLNAPKVPQPMTNVGFAFHVRFSPDASDLNGTVLLIEIGGSANGAGLYLVDGVPTFIMKQNSENSDRPLGLNDTLLNQIAVQCAYGLLSAGQTYRVALLYSPPSLDTTGEVEFAVQPLGENITVDTFLLTNARRRGDWAGNETLSIGTPDSINSSAGGLADTGLDGGTFDRTALKALNGTVTRGLYWNARGTAKSHVGTGDINWNNGQFEVEIRRMFKGAGYRLFRDVSLSFDGAQVEVDSATATDGPETLSDPNPPSGRAFYRVVEQR